MLRSLSKFGTLVVACGFTLTSATEAQTNICSLQFKVFLYDAISSSKNFVTNVDISLTSLKNEEKKSLTISRLASVFENLTEGNYRISLSKKGYKEKKKNIKLECDFADKNNILSEHIYLWKDKSTSGSEDDLADNAVETESPSKVKNSRETESVSQSKNSEDNPSKNKSKAHGKVTVQVLIDIDGNVVSAKAIDGNSLLADSAVKAARKAKFAPTMLAGNPVQVTGNIIYNFVP